MLVAPTTVEVITPAESAILQIAASALLNRKNTTSVSIAPVVNVLSLRKPVGDVSRS